MAWAFEKVAGPFDGPLGGLAWDGGGMLFSVLGEGRIARFDPATGAVTTFRKHAHGINGLAFAPDGALFGCQETSRRIVEFREDGGTALTAHLLDGRHHNQPNNLAADATGAIWFSDPHSDRRPAGPQLFPPLPHASVLRLERDARKLWSLRRMTYDTVAPRAVALAPDGATLYVAETDNRPGGRRELRAYPIRADATLGPPVVLHTFGADYRGEHRGIEGLCVARDGHVLACAGWHASGPGPLVYVFAPSGAPVAAHPVPGDRPMACAFGDADLRSLYVTTGRGELFRARDCGYAGQARGRAVAR
jgi:gluconolactonase